VEPGDQDPNGPYREPAENADTSDEPTQEEVDDEIRREDIMLKTPYVNIPNLDDPYEDPYGTKKKQ
jgi:cell division protease FtsH